MKFVFCVVLLLATLALAFGDGLQAEFIRRTTAFSAECQRESGVSTLQLVELTMMRVPNNKKVHCYLACMGKKFGVMTPDNQFTREGIIQIAAPFQEKLSQGGMYESGQKVIETCIAEQTVESDPCNAAKTAITCVMTKGREAGLIH